MRAREEHALRLALWFGVCSPVSCWRPPVSRSGSSFVSWSVRYNQVEPLGPRIPPSTTALCPTRLCVGYSCKLIIAFVPGPPSLSPSLVPQAGRSTHSASSPCASEAPGKPIPARSILHPNRAPLPLCRGGGAAAQASRAQRFLPESVHADRDRLLLGGEAVEQACFSIRSAFLHSCLQRVRSKGS